MKDSEHTLNQNAVSLPARASAQREPVGLTLGVKPEWRPQSHKESSRSPCPSWQGVGSSSQGPKGTKFGTTWIFLSSSLILLFFWLGGAI